jgi:hypothetical protein
LIAAVATAFVIRVVALDRLPGINGDEAWYAVNVNEFLAGGTPFLQTPSGNFVNPVHSLPLLLISTIAQPSLALLRVPSLLWGFLTVVLTYPLLRGPLGARAALIATVVIAISPTAVGYSRLGWDPSGTPFVTLLALACALHDRPVLMALTGMAMVAVHPTNVLAAPVICAVWATHARRRYLVAPPKLRKRLLLCAAVLLAVAVPAALVFARSVAQMGRLPSIEMVAERLTSLEGWSVELLAMIRLLSGVTTTEYLSAPMPAPARNVADAVAAIVLVEPLVFAWPLFTRDRGSLAPRLLAGTALSVIGFQMLAGRAIIEPGLERYAMCMLVPLVVLAALALDAMLTSRPVGGHVMVAAFTVALGGVLIGGYFIPLVTRGGDAHPTFRTGHVEPKQAAYAFIGGQRGSDEVVTIFADDWWAYWLMRYLAFPERHRTFVEMLGVTPPVYPHGLTPPRPLQRPDKVYAVVFEGSAAWQAVRESGTLLFTARDPIARPILHVFALPSGAPLHFETTPPYRAGDRDRGQ